MYVPGGSWWGFTGDKKLTQNTQNMDTGLSFVTRQGMRSEASRNSMLLLNSLSSLPFEKNIIRENYILTSMYNLLEFLLETIFIGRFNKGDWSFSAYSPPQSPANSMGLVMTIDFKIHFRMPFPKTLESSAYRS